MATLLQFVLSGNQSIYYGSERFMWGGDVPHNRKPMIWEELMPYEDESDVYQNNSSQTVLDTKVVYDEVENKIRYKSLLDKSMSEHYKNIIKIRNEYKELIKIYGQMEKMSANVNILVFSKSYLIMK